MVVYSTLSKPVPSLISLACILAAQPVYFVIRRLGWIHAGV